MNPPVRPLVGLSIYLSLCLYAQASRYLEYLGGNERKSILRNILCVNRGAKFVRKDNVKLWRVNVVQNLS